ncbi:CAP domain-containing protein [Arthrobacter caoxuetaonis]|uniref:CAP domain-containing protein n=1 Tax=Arthrobacter caoxuetaonis TaxID=2886935 RepID=UPI001D15AE6A|nr:CAP domain-containing protein [Arthrobacter caoxuetaonis]MCC3282035.1 CAP domain-containing protein [Arthrobacter caoxuetaonis]
MNKTKKSLGIITLSAVIGAGGVGTAAVASPSLAPAVTMEPGAATASQEQVLAEIFAEINAFREDQGLAPVQYNPVVSQTAQGWSDQMTSSGVFEHNPDYAGSPDLAGWSKAGEVIASRSDHSAQEIVQQWINSPGHNTILSDPDLNTLGIGVTFSDRDQALYAVANFFQYSPDHPATVPAPGAEASPEPAPVPEPAPEPAPVPEPAPEPAPESAPVPEPAPEPAPVPDPVPEPEQPIVNNPTAPDGKDCWPKGDREGRGEGHRGDRGEGHRGDRGGWNDPGRGADPNTGQTAGWNNGHHGGGAGGGGGHHGGGGGHHGGGR